MPALLLILGLAHAASPPPQDAPWPGVCAAGMHLTESGRCAGSTRRRGDGIVPAEFEVRRVATDADERWLMMGWSADESPPAFFRWRPGEQLYEWISAPFEGAELGRIYTLSDGSVLALAREGRSPTGEAARLEPGASSWRPASVQPDLSMYALPAMDGQGDLWLLGGGDEVEPGEGAETPDCRSCPAVRGNAEVWRYRPSTDTWERMPDLPAIRYQPIVLPQSRGVLVCGGGRGLPQTLGETVPGCVRWTGKRWKNARTATDWPSSWYKTRLADNTYLFLALDDEGHAAETVTLSTQGVQRSKGPGPFSPSSRIARVANVDGRIFAADWTGQVARWDGEAWQVVDLPILGETMYGRKHGDKMVTVRWYPVDEERWVWIGGIHHGTMVSEQGERPGSDAVRLDRTPHPHAWCENRLALKGWRDRRLYTLDDDGLIRPLLPAPESEWERIAIVGDQLWLLGPSDRQYSLMGLFPSSSYRTVSPIPDQGSLGAERARRKPRLPLRVVGLLAKLRLATRAQEGS